jgi:hypothetical protein
VGNHSRTLAGLPGTLIAVKGSISTRGPARLAGSGMRTMHTSPDPRASARMFGLQQINTSLRAGTRGAHTQNSSFSRTADRNVFFNGINRSTAATVREQPNNRRNHSTPTGKSSILYVCRTRGTVHHFPNLNTLTPISGQ